MPEIHGVSNGQSELTWAFSQANNWNGIVRVLHYKNDVPIVLKLTGDQKKPKTTTTTTFLFASEARAIARELLAAADHLDALVKEQP